MLAEDVSCNLVCFSYLRGTVCFVHSVFPLLLFSSCFFLIVLAPTFCAREDGAQCFVILSCPYWREGCWEAGWQLLGRTEAYPLGSSPGFPGWALSGNCGGHPLWNFFLWLVRDDRKQSFKLHSGGWWPSCQRARFWVGKEGWGLSIQCVLGHLRTPSLGTLACPSTGPGISMPKPLYLPLYCLLQTRSLQSSTGVKRGLD